eukprot:317988_1
MADYPTKNEIRARLEVQIKEAGRDATVKQMRLGLQAHFGKSLLNMKNLIRECIEEIIERQQAEKEGEKASESSNDEPEDEEDVQTKPPKRKRAKTTKTTGGDGDKPGRGGGPFVQLDESLADICGTDKLQRFTIVKKVWEYIRGHNLQNPNDKREIICDEKLQKVMGGKKKINMFTMNKHYKDHILK